VHQLRDARVPAKREAHCRLQGRRDPLFFSPDERRYGRTLKVDLAGYETSRGTIRFSARAGLPATLVRKLVKARIAEG
jgi:hypothetical protein